MNTGEPENAKIIFTKSVSLQPNYGFQKYMYLGQISQGKEAFDYFKKGIQILLNMKNNFDNSLTKEELSNSLCEAYCSVVELFMTDLCFEEDAEKICEDFVDRAKKEDKDGTNINVLQTTANLRLVQKNVKEAKICLKKIVELYQKGAQSTYDYKLSTCKILIEVEEYESAEEILQTLCDELETVDTWYLLGLTFKFQKEFSSAVEHFKKALALGKEEKEDKEFLKEIQKEIEFCLKQKDEIKKDQEDDEDELEVSLSEDEDIMEEIKKE